MLRMLRSTNTPATPITIAAIAKAKKMQHLLLKFIFFWSDGMIKDR